MTETDQMIVIDTLLVIIYFGRIFSNQSDKVNKIENCSLIRGRFKDLRGTRNKI